MRPDQTAGRAFASISLLANIRQITFPLFYVFDFLVSPPSQGLPKVLELCTECGALSQVDLGAAPAAGWIGLLWCSSDGR